MGPRLTSVTPSDSQPPAVRLPNSNAPSAIETSGMLAVPARGICLDTVGWG